MPTAEFLDIPVVYGRNHLGRGADQGAMIDDDGEIQGATHQLRELLARQARAQGFEPSTQWLAASIRTLLVSYERSHADFTSQLTATSTGQRARDLWRQLNDAKETLQHARALVADGTYGAALGAETLAVASARTAGLQAQYDAIRDLAEEHPAGHVYELAVSETSVVRMADRRVLALLSPPAQHSQPFARPSH